MAERYGEHVHCFTLPPSVIRIMTITEFKKLVFELAHFIIIIISTEEKSSFRSSQTRRIII